VEAGAYLEPLAEDSRRIRRTPGFKINTSRNLKEVVRGADVVP
jgi:hypothetical protein